jgi:hypothetical protein
MKIPNLRKDYHVGYRGHHTIALQGNSIFTRMITVHRHTYDENYKRISFVAITQKGPLQLRRGPLPFCKLRYSRKGFTMLPQILRHSSRRVIFVITTQ